MPKFAVLERDRRRRRDERHSASSGRRVDTARTARMGRPRMGSSVSSSAEDLTRATVEEMLAVRRQQKQLRNIGPHEDTSKWVRAADSSANRLRGVHDEDDATRRRGARKAYLDEPTIIAPPTTRIHRHRVMESTISERMRQNTIRQRLSKRDLERTAPMRCEIREVKRSTGSRLGCVIVRVVGVSSPGALHELVERATTLRVPGLAGLLIDCKLAHEAKVMAYSVSPDADTPSKSRFGSTSQSRLHVDGGVDDKRAVFTHLSILAGIEDSRRLWHGYCKRKTGSKVRMIVCGSVLSFEPIQFLGYNEALAVGTPMPEVPEFIFDDAHGVKPMLNEGGNNREANRDVEDPNARRLGTAFYRPRSKKQTNATDDGTHVHDIELDDKHDSSSDAFVETETLRSSEDYKHLSPIERALRMLGNDVVRVQEEFNARCDVSTETISISQAQKAISTLLGGVIPGECRTVLESLGSGSQFEMTFSELCILFAEKFYFYALKMEENGLRKDVDQLINNAGMKEDDLASGHGSHLEAEYEESDKFDASESMDENKHLDVDSTIKMSIMDEETEFVEKVNAAFRRFDIYGTAEYGRSNEDEEDDELGGCILLEDAPDALVACGLPIEREEAQNLVSDLASKSLSSDFQGLTKAEFELICRRIRSIFEEESESFNPSPRSGRK